MPNPVLTRRLFLGTPAAGPTLLALALADGATYGYQFTESSGNLVNFLGDPTYDLGVDAVVTRGAASPVKPALSGYHVTGAAGSSPNFGHCQGARPSQNGLASVSFEAVVKWGTVTATTVILDAQWHGIRQQFGMDTDSNNHAEGFLAAAGGNVSSFGTGVTLTQWHHYVWLSDGTHTRTYLDGVLAANNASTMATNDGSGTNATLAIGGKDPDLGTGNGDSFWAFFAAYHNVVLSQAQITAHTNASGCPAA